MTSHSATVRSEVLEALRMSAEPMSRQELLPLCPSALEAQDISFALNELRKQGMAQRTEDKRWEYAVSQSAPVGGPTPGRTDTPTDADQPERAEPASTDRGANGAAPAQADPEMHDIMRELLEHNVQHNREILETYIEALDDPILNHLLASLSAVQDALDHHNRSTAQ